MKFHIIAALVGLSQSIKISENMKQKMLIGSPNMKDICKGYMNIQKPETSLVQLRAEPGEGAADAGETTAEPAAAEPAKNIAGTHTEHYGKSKAEIDAENKAILDTQAKCMDWVKKNQDHPEVCEWCQKEYQKPDIIWKWNPAEEAWYHWYDGGWHYWGPSKDGFTGTGWTWYNGYWHHGGYVWKYEDSKWWRFQDGAWVIYGETVPVDPAKPTGGKICRPFYKMMKQGFPETLASTQVPRCKVGDNIYMWTDEAACNFLGGVKEYQERVKCQSGEEHEWKRVVKCVQGQEELQSGGFDYNTGKLHVNQYKFQECKLYNRNGSSSMYLVLFGKKYYVLSSLASRIFKSGVSVTTVSRAQFDAFPSAGSLSYSSKLVKAHGALFLYSTKMYEIENTAAFNNCNFDMAKVTDMSDADFVTKEIGDIIVAP